ncbi:Putative membrane protein insertion efficiency factor [Planctomycetes bacterium MalM25]|nr:Putative membrane protein insertion efficiency factor [Planctomycetes bacterium MalM25]
MSRIALFLSAAGRDLLSLALLAPIRGYQLFISPCLPRACRFQPTCSQYAVLAIRRHGPLRGAWKSARRIARCHPWSEGGWDPP